MYAVGMKLDKKLSFQKEITGAVRKLGLMSSVIICKIAAGMGRRKGKTSYFLTLCLTLMVVVQKDGQSVDAQDDARFCFPTLGNQIIINLLPPPHTPVDMYNQVLKHRGYTGFGHDEYYIPAMDEFREPHSNALSGEYRLQLYTVKPEGEPPLFGWFHIKVTDNQSSLPMNALVMQADMIHNNATETAIMPGFGDFLNQNLGSLNTGSVGCQANIGIGSGQFVGGEQLGKRNRINCAFTKNPYHFVGTGVAFKLVNVNSNVFDTNYYANFPVCAMWTETSFPLVFRGAVLSRSPVHGSNKQHTHLTSPKIYFQQFVYGAPDPPPPKSAKMECTEEIAMGPGANNPSIPWVAMVTAPGHLNNSKEGGQCFVEDGGRKLYYGRCHETNHQMVTPHTPATQAPPYGYTCDQANINDYYKTLPSYTDTIVQPYKDQVANCTKGCNESLQVTKTDGMSAHSDIGKEVWGLRQAHGIALTFATLFFIPWNNFNARYMKETWMEQKLVRMPVWYMTHIHLSLNILAALSAGLVTGIWSRTFFGFSLTLLAELHVILGWIAAGIFVFTMLTSGIRFEAMKLRFLGIFLHFLGGMVHYGLCLICMILSCSIPGSPSSPSRSDSSSKPHILQFELIVGATLLWIIFDLLVNILMMLLLKRSDSKMDLKGKRSFALKTVPIPLRDLHSVQDIPGSRLRKIIYVIYVLAAFALAIFVSYTIYFCPSHNRFFGRMSYTHTKGGSLQQVWKNAGYTYY